MQRTIRGGRRPPPRVAGGFGSTSATGRFEGERNQHSTAAGPRQRKPHQETKLDRPPRGPLVVQTSSLEDVLRVSGSPTAAPRSPPLPVSPGSQLHDADKFEQRRITYTVPSAMKAAQITLLSMYVPSPLGQQADSSSGCAGRYLKYH